MKPDAQTSAPHTSTQPPLVWLLSGYRAGERSQILALGETLHEQFGWQLTIKDLHYRPTALRSKLLRGSDLSGVDLPRSAPLTPPWPDIVIGAGISSEPIARWIRTQSGERTRLVHIGKPWADGDRFDLVITTPQYRLPEHPRVLQNQLTLNRIPEAQLAAAAAALKPRLAGLPGPYIAVMVGGDSGPYTLGPRAARELARQASHLAQNRGASLLVTTSARTAPGIAAILRDHLQAPSYVYDWHGDGPDHAGNPYLGYLALADEIVVTMDSVAMLSEACATGKPLHMFNVEQGDFRLGATLYRPLMQWGHYKLSRDISIVHRQLIDSGLACWLGDTPATHRPAPPPDMAHAVERVRRLIED